MTDNVDFFQFDLDTAYGHAIINYAGQTIATDPDDMCDPSFQVLLVTPWVTGGATTHRDLRNALEESCTPSQCWCEHDCCGHRHGHATATMIEFDKWLIEIVTARNF